MPMPLDPNQLRQISPDLMNKVVGSLTGNDTALDTATKTIQTLSQQLKKPVPTDGELTAQALSLLGPQNTDPTKPPVGITGTRQLTPPPASYPMTQGYNKRKSMSKYITIEEAISMEFEQEPVMDSRKKADDDRSFGLPPYEFAKKACKDLRASGMSDDNIVHSLVNRIRISQEDAIAIVMGRDPVQILKKGHAPQDQLAVPYKPSVVSPYLPEGTAPVKELFDSSAVINQVPAGKGSMGKKGSELNDEARESFEAMFKRPKSRRL